MDAWKGINGENTSLKNANLYWEGNFYGSDLNTLI